MGVLYPNVEHLILVGDHKQLRPSVNCYDLAKKLFCNLLSTINVCFFSRDSDSSIIVH